MRKVKALALPNNTLKQSNLFYKRQLFLNIIKPINPANLLENSNSLYSPLVSLKKEERLDNLNGNGNGNSLPAGRWEVTRLVSVPIQNRNTYSSTLR